MKIRMRTSAATPLGTYSRGAVVDVPDDIGEGWCRSKLAEKVKGEEKEEKKESAAITPPKNAMEKPAVARVPGKKKRSG